ncbi:methyl transferase [Ilyonectria destructans]|nr:methyl transferase [Ilyonectria destructans]
MVVMSTQNSIPESEGRYLQDGYWRHGRFYGSWKRGKYLFPIDSEELNRLDIFHKVFLVARENKPFRAPIVRPAPRFMDLGTGTSIWGITVAEECFPDCELMTVDLNQIQPALIPVGVKSQQFDIEEPEWGPLLTECDLIHLRMLLGSLRTDIWPQTYRKVFEHLAPGIGHMEHVEIDWTPRWDDKERPAQSAFEEWAELFYDGMDQFNRRARVLPHETRQMIEAAGFTDIREEVIKAYVCPWSNDRAERELARWFNLGLTHSLEALSLMPLIEKQGMKFEDVRELCEKVKKEICVLRYHTYCTIHVWTARKPEGEQPSNMEITR